MGDPGERVGKVDQVAAVSLPCRWGSGVTWVLGKQGSEAITLRPIP